MEEERHLDTSFSRPIKIDGENKAETLLGVT